MLSPNPLFRIRLSSYFRDSSCRGARSAMRATCLMRSSLAASCGPSRRFSFCRARRSELPNRRSSGLAIFSVCFDAGMAWGAIRNITPQLRRFYETSTDLKIAKHSSIAVSFRDSKSGLIWRSPMTLRTYSGFALSSAVMVADTLSGYPASAWTSSRR